MKAAPFDYVRAGSVGEAIAALARPGAKIVAGNQSLGPMMALRLAQPPLLVDITRIRPLYEAREDKDAISYGACIRHAAFEDGQVPDLAGGALARVAAGIAYRAVRTRGTIGGSLAHADPAADWITALTALGAELVIEGARGPRRTPLAGFVSGAFESALGDGEVLTAIRVPKPSPQARFVHRKFCRRTGELADAMCAVLIDPPRGVARIVIGSTEGAPILVPTLDGDAIEAALIRIADPVKRRMQRAIVRRARDEVAQ